MSKQKKKNSTNIEIGKIIENSLQKLDEIEDCNFDTAKILAEYSLFDLSKKIITKLVKSDFNEIDFISAISKYLFLSNINLIEENQLETHKVIIKETKTFFKYIKKSLRKVENKFDKTYLLYSRDSEDFYAIDNAKLLDSLEELSQILNLTNYHREAELAFELKSKIELGFQRYFLYEKDSVLIWYFNSKGEYKVANNLEVMKILDYFKVNIVPKIDFKTNNFRDILIQLKYLKDKNKLEFNKILKKYVKFIEFFPELIYTKDEYDKYKKIAKSINKNFEDNNMRLVKEKVVLVNPYNIESYNLVLKILK